MTYQEAIEFLRKHNAWRRYDGPIGEGPEMVGPKELGEAIDMVCDTLEGQNERANKLTWQDVKDIVTIADSMLVPDTCDCIDNWGSEQAYYEEVLHRFHEKIQK